MIHVVDDNPEILKMIKQNFGPEYALKTFLSAEDALRTLVLDKPRVVISDVMMPGINGLDFLDIARSILKEHTAFFIISGNPIEQIKKDLGDIPEGINIYSKSELDDEFFDIVEKEYSQRPDPEEIITLEYAEDNLKRLRNMETALLEMHTNFSKDAGTNNITSWSEKNQKKYLIQKANCQGMRLVLGINDEECSRLLKKWGLT